MEKLFTNIRFRVKIDYVLVLDPALCPCSSMDTRPYRTVPFGRGTRALKQKIHALVVQWIEQVPPKD